MATTTNNNGSKAFTPCSHEHSTNEPPCGDTSLLRIRGLCRMHYITTLVDPVTRAETLHLKELDKFQSKKKKLLAELSVAEQVHVSHDLRLLCHKCGVVTIQGYMALQQHEIYCNGRSKSKPTGKLAGKPRTPKVTTDYDDDDEEMTDVE